MTFPSVGWARRFATTLAATCVVLGMLGTSPARADSYAEGLAALDRAIRATSAAAAAGIDVEQFISYRAPFNLAASHPRIDTTLRSGSRLRIHVTAASDDSGYTSVRLMPSGRLLAAGGIDPASGALWVTVRMLSATDQERARRMGISAGTALIDIDPDYVVDSFVATEPRSLALRALLPPYATSSDEGWSTIETIPLADGGMVIRGTIAAGVPASDGEDTCVRPLVEITVGPDMVIRSSRWRETCPRGGALPAGTRSYQTTATYGPVAVKGPVSPSRPASDLSLS